MAHNIRIPALLWRTLSGNYTLSLIHSPVTHMAVAATREEALREMSEYLESFIQTFGAAHVAAELGDISIRNYSVSAPAQYQAGGRIYNCGFEVRVRVPGAVGVQESGDFLCAVPALNLRFDFQSEGEERPLVQHFIKYVLQSQSPRVLSTIFSDSDPELVDVVVRIKEKSTNEGLNDLQRYGALANVAEPIVRGRGLRARFPAAWRREEVSDGLLRLLEGSTGSLLVVGEPGSGKSTVIVDAALRLAERRGERANPICWRTSAHRLIAGMRYLGQWEERCEEVIGILASFRGVLCMEDLIGLIRTGGHEPVSSIAAFLAPFIARGELRLIAETTPGELEACRRLLPGFCDLFQITTLPKLNFDDSVAILRLLREGAYQRSKLEMEPAAELLHSRLHERFLSYETLPGRLIRSFRQVIDQAEQQKRTKVSSGDILSSFSRETGLPLHLLDNTMPLGFEEAHAYFRERIIDQPAAAQTAANVVATFKAGLQDPNRPLAVLLFCGPTGVGKTAMAKAMAEFLYGAGDDKERLIRLDMSEYAGYDAVHRLLGVPGGEPSALIRKVRSQPFQVILLDEIEKASPAVYDVLLNAFDEGRLREADGRDTFFRNAIFVMTSNLGTTGKPALGFGDDGAVSYVQEAMRFFRPEFVNRIDEIVAFSPLSQGTIRKIAELELKGLADREGIRERGITLVWDDAILEKVAAAGFDARYGARPLQRAVEDHAVAPVALYLAQHPATRNVTLRVAADGSTCVEQDSE